MRDKIEQKAKELEYISFDENVFKSPNFNKLAKHVLIAEIKARIEERTAGLHHGLCKGCRDRINDLERELKQLEETEV